MSSYKPKEEEFIYDAFKEHIDLDVMCEHLPGRSKGSIVQHIWRMSKKHPERWDPDRAAEYLSEGNGDYAASHRNQIKRTRMRWYYEGGGKEWSAARYNKNKAPKNAPTKEQIQAMEAERRIRKRERYARWVRRNRGKYELFGNYLQTACMEFDGSKEEFAEDMKVHPSTFSRYLSGDRKPTQDFLEKLSRMQHVPRREVLRLVE
jgi:hypothetical protein